MRTALLKVALGVASAVLVAWMPTPTQAQFPTYYPGYYPAYGWNPYGRYAYAVYPDYYYMPPAYSTWVPGYGLPPVQQGAYTYWYRSTYVPYYSSYYRYRPTAYYVVGY